MISEPRRREWRRADEIATGGGRRDWPRDCRDALAYCNSPFDIERFI